jgi:hypothetical protein
MKFTLRNLTISLKQGDEPIPLAQVSYFFGQMGAGKTSIARLIDYCLGGTLDLSPALQSEFVGATLQVELERGLVNLERQRDSNRVVARFADEGSPYQLNVPTREASGVLIPSTEIENLSDLIFWLSNVRPPRVRKSKTKDETTLERLSIRDLLWYCYLDQDSIDSEFFHLDDNGNPWMRLKSRDVLRFVIGFHEEKVAEIEAELDQLRIERQALQASIAGLSRALKEVGVDSAAELQLRIAALHVRAAAIEADLVLTRERVAADHNDAGTSHAADALRASARELGNKVAVLDDAVNELERAIDRDRRHLGEIETLMLKYQRSVSAKAILAGVTFESCPRCARVLPSRDTDACSVCGQEEEVLTDDPGEVALLERDSKARIAELKDIITRHEKRVGELRRERGDTLLAKERIERERNEASRYYDSAYLSTAIANETERASLLQEATNLTTLLRLPQAVSEYKEQSERLGFRETALRRELKEARTAAESDSANLDHLKELFHDCLLRSGVPGISGADRVEIATPSFLPRVYGPEALEATVTSFANMSSGGKKTLFKCCFAVAVHRLAVQIGATLPEFLMIDSPMKNISERENREQFEGFHRMLYDLKASELASTQVILIDKEFCPPPVDTAVTVVARHMRPNDENSTVANSDPPLIPYYRGH